MKWMKHIVQFKGSISLAATMIATYAAIWGQGWWCLIAVAVMAFHTYLIARVFSDRFTPADNAYWRPPAVLIQKIIPTMFIYLRNHGYGKTDYLKERHDCDDYALAGMVAFHDLMMAETINLPEALNKAFPVYPFSFTRENGKRHRLFFVEDDKGIRHYIENYPVFDKYHDDSGMYRILTAKEELNGRTIS